jgi:hypothetical protein
MASSKTRRGGRTAIEFEQHLRETGKYDEILEHQRKQREEWRRREVEERLAAAALYRDLEAAGYQVDDVWDLHGRTSYPEAVPVLLKHLPCPYPEKVREGIALAVAVPATLAYWDLLVRLYKEEKEGYIKDRISDAISVVANKDKIGEVISLARDRTLGPSRIMLLRKISRSRDPRASAALLELASDPDLVKEVRVILRRKGIKVP